MKLSEFIKKYGDCEITEEMDKCIKKKGKWMPEIGETYWYIDSSGSVQGISWKNTNVDNYRRDFMRIFKTHKEIVRYLAIIRACKEASFEPDWKNDKQYKWFFEWIDNDRELNISYSFLYNKGCQFYFKSGKIMEELINKFGEKDIVKYLFNIEIN